MKTQLKQLMVVVLSVLGLPLLAAAILKGEDCGCIMLDDLWFDYRFEIDEPLLEYGMPVEEAVRLIGLEEVTHEKLLALIGLIRAIPTVRSKNLRIFKSVKDDSVEYLVLEVDEQQKVKNLFKVKKEDTYLLEDDGCGAYAELFNSIKVGDDYDEVKRKMRYLPEARFYCEYGVWYVEYSFTFNGKDYPLIFFAATGKVASVKRVDLAFERAYSKRIKRGELSLEVEEEAK